MTLHMSPVFSICGGVLGQWRTDVSSPFPCCWNITQLTWDSPALLLVTGLPVGCGSASTGQFISVSFNYSTDLFSSTADLKSAFGWSFRTVLFNSAKIWKWNQHKLLKMLQRSTEDFISVCVVQSCSSFVSFVVFSRSSSVQAVWLCTGN